MKNNSNCYCSPLVSLKAVVLFVAVVVFILSDHSSLSWIIMPTPSSFVTTSTAGRRMLVLVGNGNNDGKPDDAEEHVHLGLDPQNPCWQDIADEDCALSTAYSASFIAKDWIQSMPCAEGIAVCTKYLLLCRFSIQ